MAYMDIGMGGGKEARLAPALWPKLWAKVGLLVKVRQTGAVGED